jgi:hypothetical protein
MSEDNTDSDEELRNDLRAKRRNQNASKNDQSDEESEGENPLSNNMEKYDKEYDTKDKEGEVFNASVDSIEEEVPKKNENATSDDEIE